MYNYIWDEETGGYLLDTKISGVTKELRPVFHEELDLLGFSEYWDYEPSEYPLLWAETRRYFYKGELVAEANGGGLFTKPTIKVHKTPLKLEHVNINEMINRNSRKMIALVQDTAQEIYKRYNEYKNKVDVTYVAFSGGKDSLVLLDLVQKTLPHDEFKVIFSDTTMEISDTYKTVEKVQELWPTLDFYTAKCHMDATETWKLFAPPAKIHRWCCAVHKSVPSLMLLKNIVGSQNIRALVIDGVRAEESDARASYSVISDGHKHTTQVNCSPILDWGTDELYLYIFENKLLINNAYRNGSTRVGCALCPMSSPWRDFITNSCYSEDTEKYLDILKEYGKSTGIQDNQMSDFLQSSGWRNRAGGRGLEESSNLVIRNNENSISFELNKIKTDWKEWIKTISNPIPTDNPDIFNIEYKGSRYELTYTKNNDREITVSTISNTPECRRLTYCLRNVFGKVAYCIGCKACEVECPTGALTVSKDGVKISNDCVRCEKCLEKSRGCYAAKSFYSTIGGKGMNSMKGMHRYGTFGLRAEWIKLLQQSEIGEFWTDNKLGPDQYDGFKKWLIDAEIMHQNDISEIGEHILKMSPTSNKMWGVIATNISYNSIIFNWFIKNVEKDIPYSKNEYVIEIGDDYPERTRVNALSSLISTLVDSPLANGDSIDYKNIKGEFILNGIIASCEVKNKKVISVTRAEWQNPDPLVILYALYKFAEKCDGHYGFTLSYLCDDSIEREGISPTRLFGIGEEEMRNILLGLSRQYPEYIGVEFQKDLDNIDLNRNSSSLDIIRLF